MKFSLAFSLLFLFAMLKAQVVPDEFGTVKTDYLNMKSYPADDLAEAVVLYDFGKTYFINTDYGFRIVFERTRKIKILEKSGIEYADVEIPYYVENSVMEKVFGIDGYTFNFQNGSMTRTRLDPKATFNEKVNDHWMVKKFTMPDVKEGSVIEYKYKVESPYFVNLPDWEFQSRIPTVYSEYTVGLIPFYEYSYILNGAKKFDVFRNFQSAMKRNFGGVEYSDNVYTFGMKNIPAFRDEAYITSVNDYLIKLDFQLAVLHHLNGANVEYITTWPLLIDKMLKESEFGLYLKGASRNAGEILTTLDLSTRSDTEKADIIYDYIKSNFNWDGYSTKFAGKSIKEFIKTKTGNSGDINLFLCAMLNEAGIQAYPVILSTRSHGKVRVDFPFHQFLNYVIVMAECENNKYFLDATEPMAPFGMLPARCINDKGLVVVKGKTEWVQLADNITSYEIDSVRINLSSGLDSVNVVTTVTSGGHCALDLRRDYASDSEEFLKHLIPGDVKIHTPLNPINLNEGEKPFIYHYGFKIPVETVSGRILIDPFPGLVPEENELKMSYRNYPVDMIYSNTNGFHSEIEVPENYRLAESLKDTDIDNDLVKISYITRVLPDKLIIDGSYAFKKAIYYPHEYFELRRMFTTIIDIFNRAIILVPDAG